MAGIWIFFALVQIYFYTVLTSYGSSQRRDHRKYDEVYDPVRPLTSDIPMTNRGDAWDSSDSSHQSAGRGYNHVRQDSDASVSTVLGDKFQKPQEGFSDAGYGGYSQPAYPPQPSTSDFSHPPPHAHTQEPGPTPTYYDSYYSGGNPYVDRPAASQTHPGKS
jgi:hypothetical protein